MSTTNARVTPGKSSRFRHGPDPAQFLQEKVVKPLWHIIEAKPEIDERSAVLRSALRSSSL